MADYYSILNKTISGLPSNNAQNRNMVYARARTAIDKQLRAITPPPGEEVIARQMASLEEAIRTIEAENAAQQPTAPPPAAPTPTQPAAPAATPRPAPPQSPAAPVSPAPATAPEFSVAGERGQPAPQTASVQKPGGTTQPPAYDSSLDALSDTDRPVSLDGPRSGGLPGDRTRGKRRSGIVPALVVIVVLALIGAGGYALWLNKEPLMASLGLNGQPQQSETAEPDVSDTDAQDADQPVEESGGAQKEETRLGSDGSTVAPEPRDVTSDAQDPASQGPADQDDDTAGEEIADSLAPDGQLDSGETGPGTGEPGNDGQQVNPVDDGGGQTDTAIAPAQSATQLGQKAYLYEEGVSSAPASRDDGEMVWSIDQDSPEEGQPREPVIKGRLDIPSRGLTMDMLIRRNTDESLSASHLIEIVFKTPSDFTGGSIDTIARFVMKPSEQARGEPLIAVPVKISTGYFMIALNNLEQAREANEKLMVDADWIDIPLSYSTGRRALVTISKGESGKGVFDEAFEDWKNR